ncbi:MAG: DUF2840 domain-containing protein [Acidimicrobiales bacterium]|nr:MAG: DUF2840 domain-containing protein [Acidimicrobiales bacterium]
MVGRARTGFRREGGLAMSYTLVKSDYRPDVCNHRLRFGAPVHVVRMSKCTTYFAFKHRDVFGYIRWNRNDFGTINWQFIVARCAHETCQTSFPGIHPGVDLLFRARGVKAVKTSLAWMDRLEKTAGKPLEKLPVSFWRKAENSRIIRAKLPLYKARALEPFHV